MPYKTVGNAQLCVGRATVCSHSVFLQYTHILKTEQKENKLELQVQIYRFFFIFRISFKL